jgi:hypothetical protein
MQPATYGPYSLLGPGRRLERAAVNVMTLLSVLGLFILYRRDSLSALVFLIILGLYPLIYYFIQYDCRYRYPILWVTFLLGSLPIAAFAQHTYGIICAFTSKRKLHQTVTELFPRSR